MYCKTLALQKFTKFHPNVIMAKPLLFQLEFSCIKNFTNTENNLERKKVGTFKWDLPEKFVFE